MASELAASIFGSSGVLPTDSALSVDSQGHRHTFSGRPASHHVAPPLSCSPIRGFARLRLWGTRESSMTDAEMTQSRRHTGVHSCQKGFPLGHGLGQVLPHPHLTCNIRTQTMLQS